MSKKTSTKTSESSVAVTGVTPGKKKVIKKTDEPVTTTTPPVTVDPQDPEVPEKPRKKNKSKKVTETQDVQNIQETQTPSEPDEGVNATNEDKESDQDAPKRPVGPASKETLLTFVDDLMKLIDGDIDGIKTEKKVVGIKRLKTYRKLVKTLKTTTQKVIKQKVKRVKSESHKITSGFQKPVQITSEMANFIGVDPNELISRVSVTKAICKYIKDRKLQDKDSRRVIIADDPLSALLRYDSTSHGKLTFPLLQRYMKIHFIKVTK